MRALDAAGSALLMQGSPDKHQYCRLPNPTIVAGRLAVSERQAGTIVCERVVREP